MLEVDESIENDLRRSHNMLSSCEYWEDIPADLQFVTLSSNDVCEEMRDALVCIEFSSQEICVKQSALIFEVNDICVFTRVQTFNSCWEQHCVLSQSEVFLFSRVGFDGNTLLPSGLWDFGWDVIFNANEVESNLQNASPYFSLRNLIAFIPRNTLGYVTSSSFIMGIIFRFLASRNR